MFLTSVPEPDIVYTRLASQTLCLCKCVCAPVCVRTCGECVTGDHGVHVTEVSDFSVSVHLSGLLIAAPPPVSSRSLQSTRQVGPGIFRLQLEEG